MVSLMTHACFLKNQICTFSLPGSIVKLVRMLLVLFKCYSNDNNQNIIKKSVTNVFSHYGNTYVVK